MPIILNQSQNHAVQAYVNSNPTIFEQPIDNEIFRIGAVGFTFSLNSILRANIPLLNINPYLMELDSAFVEHRIEQPLTVYRVCNYLEMIRYIRGDSYVDLGYMSTSMNSEVTHRFFSPVSIGCFPAFITIRIPEGSNVLPLNGIVDFDNTTYEDEVLIKRNSIFTITRNELVRTTGLDNLIGRENVEAFTEIRLMELGFTRYF